MFELSWSRPCAVNNFSVWCQVFTKAACVFFSCILSLNAPQDKKTLFFFFLRCKLQILLPQKCFLTPEYVCRIVTKCELWRWQDALPLNRWKELPLLMSLMVGNDAPLPLITASHSHAWRDACAARAERDKAGCADANERIEVMSELSSSDETVCLING